MGKVEGCEYSEGTVYVSVCYIYTGPWARCYVHSSLSMSPVWKCGLFMVYRTQRWQMKAINVQHSLKPPLSEIIFNEYAVKGSGLLKTILPPCNKMNVYRQTEHTARLRWGIAAEKLLWQFRVIKWTGTNDLWVWGMSLIQNYFRGKCCSCCRAGANGSSAKDKMWQARGIQCDV